MNYNPRDILSDSKASAHYEEVANAVIERRGNAFMSKFVSEKCYNFFSESELPYYNAYGKLAGSTLNLLNIIDVERLLKSFQYEQILFLKNNPKYLKRELTISLSLSSLLLNEHYRRTEIVNGKSILKLLWKGAEKLYKERLDRRREEMMKVIYEPLSLLLNSYYYNKNQDITTIDVILEDIISIPYYAWDNDELCIHTLKSFMEDNLNTYLHKHIKDLYKHAESNITIFPSLLPLLNKTDSFINDRLNELNCIEKEKYNYYRNEVEKWCSTYPANENSENFEMVTNVLSHLSCPITVKTSLSTQIDFSSSTPTLIEEANRYFYEKKHFKIPQYYVRIFKDIGEIVSYWNAFDNNKNEKLEMDL